MEAVLNTILLELHRLAARDIHRRTVLALVGFESNVAFPLALEVALLGGDSFLATVEAVAPEILVALLNKAKPSLIPDQPVEVRKRGASDKALVLEKRLRL